MLVSIRSSACAEVLRDGEVGTRTRRVTTGRLRERHRLFDSLGESIYVGHLSLVQRQRRLRIAAPTYASPFVGSVGRIHYLQARLFGIRANNVRTGTLTRSQALHGTKWS